MKATRLKLGMVSQKSGTHATSLPVGGSVVSSTLQPFLKLQV